jgi:UDP-glucose 4-epimerase
MSKILVTGGAGFIGSHIVDHMLAAGHSVDVLDDLSSGCLENVPKGVSLHQLDICSSEARAVVKKLSPDVVVHAAAQISVRKSMEDPAEDARVNVQGLVSLLSELRDNGSSAQCVFLSTGGAIYGEQALFPAGEDHPVVPESVYGLSKWVGEQYLHFWARAWGLQVTVLRLANVYGPRQNPHGEAGVVAIFCKGLLQGTRLVVNGSGEQTRDFVFVGDVARAAALCVQKRVTGTFNIGTGVETSVSRLVESLRAASGVEGHIENGPAKEGEQLRSCIDPSTALQKIGWKAEISLPEGVRLTMDWFRQNSRRG